MHKESRSFAPISWVAALTVALVLAKVSLDWGLTFWQAAFIDSLTHKAHDRFLVLVYWLPAILGFEALFAWGTARANAAWVMQCRGALAARMGPLITKGAVLVSAGATQQDLVQTVVEDSRTVSELRVTLIAGAVGGAATALLFGGTLWAAVPRVHLLGLTIPAPLVWFSFAVFGLSSLAIHKAGRSLPAAEAKVVEAEAHLRSVPSRLREHARSVALLRGAEWEASAFRAALSALQPRIVRSAAIKGRVQALGTFIGPSDLLLWIVLSPVYFAGELTLGQLFQASMAHRGVGMALDWIVGHYPQWARWRVASRRIADWERSVREAYQGSAIAISQGGELRVEHLTLSSPAHGTSEGAAWQRLYPDAAIPKGRAVVIRAPSGYGKSVLFAALGGIWPWGSGRVTVPERAIFLPQKPYFPTATLLEALCYPGAVRDVDHAPVIDLLRDVGLNHLGAQLGETRDWNAVLSAGEAARAALVRALLQRPEWLLMDEPSANLDPASTRLLWQAVARARVMAVVISHTRIAHLPDAVELVLGERQGKQSPDVNAIPA